MFWQRGHYFATRGHFFVTVSESSVVIISSRFSVSVILTSVRHFWRVGTGCCHFSDKGIVTVTVGRQRWPEIRQNWPFDDLSSQIDIAVILTGYGRYWRVRTGWCHFWRIWAVSDSHMVTNDSHIVRTDVSIVIDVPAVIQRPRILRKILTNLISFAALAVCCGAPFPLTSPDLVSHSTLCFLVGFWTTNG